jgi:hypothetical protein
LIWKKAEQQFLFNAEAQGTQSGIEIEEAKTTEIKYLRVAEILCVVL